MRQVSVPAEVRQLLADLRSHLAEKVEPPVYISDRRLVKSVALMQASVSCMAALPVTRPGVAALLSRACPL